MKLPFSSKYVSLLATAAVLIALYTVGCVSFPNFGSLRVGVNLIGDNAFLGVAAIGATFVILSGGIDLSVGAAVAFTSILIASLVGSGVYPFVAILAALLVAHYTPFGRYIYALGGDEQSATLMGLPVGRTKIFTYTVSGFCSALAGVVYTFLSKPRKG